MKTLTSHMNEALKIGRNLGKFSTYSCQPKTNVELNFSCTDLYVIYIIYKNKQ